MTSILEGKWQRDKDNPYQIVDDTGLSVALVASHWEDSEQCARLIVKAPEMYHALRLIAYSLHHELEDVAIEAVKLFNEIDMDEDSDRDEDSDDEMR